MSQASTKEKILDFAQEFVQKNGFNAFSFADLARKVRIKTASIHYYFPSKADLGVEMIRRYRQNFLTQLEKLEQSNSSPRLLLESLAKKMNESLCRDKRVCLCAMLGSDFATLPSQMRVELSATFESMRSWCAKQFEAARRQRQLKFTGAPEDIAALYVGSLQGLLLYSRSLGKEDEFTARVENFFALLE